MNRAMASSLRLFAPRASLALHARQLKPRLLLPGIRHQSSDPLPKPRVLAKPDKFNPPSHPSRIRSKPKYYGPDLSKTEKEAQKVRKYPHMMPPEGTNMHWFLTQRNLHLYIALSVLLTLTFSIWLEDFLHTTPFREFLPPNSMVFSHPIIFCRRWAETYNMHVKYKTAQSASERAQKVDDIQKRAEYRKAHGLEDDDGSLGGWTAKGDPKDPAAREGGSNEASPVALEALPSALEATVPNEDNTYIDFEGKKQPAQKKWFGSW